MFLLVEKHATKKTAQKQISEPHLRTRVIFQFQGVSASTPASIFDSSTRARTTFFC